MTNIRFETWEAEQMQDAEFVAAYRRDWLRYGIDRLIILLRLAGKAFRELLK